MTIEDHKKVVEPGEAKFSPDGKQIAYVYKGEPFIVPADAKKAAVCGYTQNVSSFFSHYVCVANGQ